ATSLPNRSVFMASVVSPIPTRVPLIFTPLGDDRGCVIKNPRSGRYFQLGPEEHFLLIQLDSRRSNPEICRAYGDRFGKALAEDELADFLEQAEAEELILPVSYGQFASQHSDSQPASVQEIAHSPATYSQDTIGRAPAKQSLLYWRKRLFDPDRLFGW